MKSLPIVSLLAAILIFAPVRAQSFADAQAALEATSDGLVFVENQGQWPDDVRFRARLGGADIWITDDGLVYDFYKVVGPVEELEARRGSGAMPELSVVEREGPETARRGHVVEMRFEGAKARRAEGRGQKQTYHNYFLGDDPSRWASRVPLYEEVVLEDLYDGVDLRLYDDGGFLRYDLVLAPGIGLDQVRLRLEGADSVSLTREGALRMETALGPVEQRGLLAYQEDALGRREELQSTFVLDEGGTLGFSAEGADPARSLVVDPLLWATFLGGTSNDRVWTIALGADGSTTVAGETTGADFPSTTGAYDHTFNGPGTDGYVARLSADGSTLEWASFLGGPNSESAYALALGADGSATAVGIARGLGFPTTTGAYDQTFNGQTDAFVARVSPDGSALVYSTFLGGTNRDEAWAVAVGDDGTATVGGWTWGSAEIGGTSDFPTTAGAYDETYSDGQTDAFVARVSPDGSALVYSTFLGGTNSDEAHSVAVGSDGTATVAGHTSSLDFPTTAGAYDETYNGNGRDAFVAQLSGDGSALVYSTFLGGTNNDYAFAVAVGADGSATVAGITGSIGSPGFPATAGAYDESSNGSSDGFVARFSADGSALVWATFLGGTDIDQITAVAVGSNGAATVAGFTYGSDFPTTAGAYDETHNGGGRDAFVAQLSGDGSALVYSTFLGGTGSDQAWAVAVGSDETATVGGWTYGPDFPTTVGAFDETYNGRQDGFIVVLDVASAQPNQSPEADAGEDQTVMSDGSCQALVSLDGSESSDPDGDALTYSWTDAEGTEIATGEAPGITLGLGIHTVTLTVTDPSGESDTDEVVVTVEDTAAPTLVLSEEPLVLWPANHKYHTVSLSDLALMATDDCNGPLDTGTVVISSVSSDEADDGTGDGNTTDDVLIDGCDTVRLRAERQGSGNGRVYTLTLAVSDGAGNVGTATYEVHVPKSKKETAVAGPVAYAVEGCAANAPLAQDDSDVASTASGSATAGAAEASRSGTGAPVEFALTAVYPNPVLRTAIVGFAVPEAADVRVVVYDVLGRTVAVLVDGPVEAGRHTTLLEAAGLPSGTYLVRMSTEGGFADTWRITLLR